MRVCFVVNNPRTQRASYTSLHLAFAAYRRGHDVAFASVDAFSQGEGSDLVAEVVRPKSGRLKDTAGYAKALTSTDAPKETARLVDFDVIFLRNNPSAGAAEVDAFNPALDFGRRLKQLGVLVVNDPDGLSRAGSKMYLAGFPVELRPKTLITRSVERVRAFLRELDGPAIIKPLSGFGGQNVFYVARGQAANLLLGGAPLEVGETVAAYKRMRPKDDIRNNMHVGGSRRRTDFPEAERRICDLLRPRLVADGLYFVGVDLVGDKILEINVFATGGIANINELYSIDVGTAVIRDLERKVELRSVYHEPIPPHVFMRA
jgi:glutathione synthase